MQLIAKNLWNVCDRRPLSFHLPVRLIASGGMRDSHKKRWVRRTLEIRVTDEKDALPSDAETSGLKPQKPKDREPETPPPDDPKEEEDPSEQPS